MEKPRKNGLTPLQSAFIEKIFEVKTPTEAVMQIYRPKSRHCAANMAHQLMQNPKIRYHIDGLNISDIELAQKLRECLNAGTEVRTANGAKVFLPNWNIVLKSLELVFRLKGYIGAGRNHSVDSSIAKPIVKFVRK